jgi:Protein of unknown function (DUF3147)
MSLIQPSTSGFKLTRWYDYAIRFAFGGLITAAAGLIAKKYGANVGGLFLAFPAIFPASVTLVERHAKEKHERAGGHGTVRGEQDAASCSYGAMLGSFGLLAFAGTFYALVREHSLWWVLPLATVAWFAVSVTLWLLRKRVVPVVRRKSIAETRRTRSLKRAS